MRNFVKDFLKIYFNNSKNKSEWQSNSKVSRNSRKYCLLYFSLMPQNLKCLVKNFASKLRHAR